VKTRCIRWGLGILVICSLVRGSQAVAGAALEYAWKAGVARVNITPQRPVVLLGYGDRTGPFEAVAADIYAKALALEDARGQRAVLITADLVGFQAAVMTDEVCRRIMEKTGLERRQLLLNASHSHTGPLLSLDPNPEANSVAHPPLTEADIRETQAYTRRLQDQLVGLVEQSLAQLQPAQLAWGAGQVGFPTNRRLSQNGRVVMADNPAGVTDRTVPVLRVQAADGPMLAVLFGCACHNTTLTGRDNVIAGDYAGCAQETLERRHAASLALFVSGCGADANPSPRGSMDLARQHGETLAAEVDRVLSGELAAVSGDLVTTLRYVDLPLQQLRRDELAARASWPTAEASMARQMLAVLDRGEQLPTAYRAPVAVWQFGHDLTLLGLPAEPVAEYVSLLRETLGSQALWIAGFNNDCFGYLPTARIVREGGHEAIGVTLWIWSQVAHRQVGFFAPEVEEIVLRETRRLAREAGRAVPDTLLPATGVPDWGVFPQQDWMKCSPADAGFDAEKLAAVLAAADVHGGTWGGVPVGPQEWGAVLTRGGRLVHAWGDPAFKQPSASLGKCMTRALFGITVEAGLIDPDAPVQATWTGHDELSHPHKYLDVGNHRTLTWRQLLEHQGGFVLESGFHWRNRVGFHATLPEGTQWTGDPLADNYAHLTPGTQTLYSSGGYVRLGQALTAAWNRDLKDVLQERLFDHLGIPPQRWDWLTTEEVHRRGDFYPEFPGYGEYVDPPYTIGGHAVRGGPGWMVMSAEDLARFGLLVATGGVWNGRRLVGSQWLRGHAGLDIHVVAGDRDSLVSIAKINTKGFPFGQDVGTQGVFTFPPQLIAGAPGATPSAAAAPVDSATVTPPAKSVPAPLAVRVEKNVRIPMRDGVTLAAEVQRPEVDGQFPALLQMSYYVTGPGPVEALVPRGYVCIMANSRGRGGSEGDWDPYVNEPRDVYDAQEWAAHQPWCNGRVGMFGQSYNAFTQTMSAPLANPHFQCMVPVEGQQSFFGHQYNDGVLQLNVVFTHGLFATGATGLQGHIPLDDPHFLQLPLMAAADRVAHPQAQRIKTWLAHARYDDFWKSFGVKEKYAQIKTPAYFVSGWYDNLVHENFRNFLGFRHEGGTPEVRTTTRLRVGPGVHGYNPLPMTEYLRWYDHWLKDQPTGIDQEAPLEIYVMGANCWRDEYEWPLARTQFTKFYLRSGGRANSLRGDGQLVLAEPPSDAPADKYVYDPAHPVYTLGGQISTNPEIWGPQDRQSVAARDDVLVYTSEPLAADTEVTGPLELKLFAASSAVDTDWAATLTDVYPDGRAIHICEGIRGAAFRESLEHPTPIEPGKIYEYSISLWETSQVFLRGHRIRLEVTSSNFPRYARNQNTGLPLGTSAEIKTAEQQIFHDAAHSSCLFLPVIPAPADDVVRARADGSWRLTARTARLAGPTLKLAAEAGVLGWWTSADDTAQWTIDVPRRASYGVRVNFACDPASAGNTFLLTVGDSRLEGQVPATGSWFDQRELACGEIELPDGRQTVTLRAAGALHGGLFDFRALSLAPPDGAEQK
jgi:putative CocE/NonD family hydrolase